MNKFISEKNEVVISIMYEFIDFLLFEDEIIPEEKTKLIN